ncbi:hypothetical protein J4416_04980 [Candidatus Pacearchaeota archaeon]|nr:hypothetical protein [Candidatus Pacearchaeota archaeon]
MNKHVLIGLTALVLAGCVSDLDKLKNEVNYKPGNNQEKSVDTNVPIFGFPHRKDISYVENREGYFTDDNREYFGMGGKRYAVEIDKNGIKKHADSPMKFDGKNYYINLK